MILFSIKHCPIGVHSTNEDPLEANMFWLNLLNLSFEMRHNRIEKAVKKVRTVFLTQRRELNVEIIIVGKFLRSNNITLGRWVKKNDPVWMEKSGFEECAVGDSVSFCAEVYRYVKTGNGKLIDYGLRNPTGIQKIEAYELPSDDELIMQEVEQLICETCFLSEQCNRNYCTMDPKKKRLLKQEMFRAIKAQTDKETQK